MLAWKATRPDGTDFWTGTIDYAEACRTGEPVRVPERAGAAPGAHRYLSAATVPTECTGTTWPFRLYRVWVAEPTFPEPKLPFKVAGREIVVLNQRNALLALGPQGFQVSAFLRTFGVAIAPGIEEIARLAQSFPDVSRQSRRDPFTLAQKLGRSAALRTARGAAEDRVREAWARAGGAPYGDYALRYIVRHVMSGLVMRDVLDREIYDDLTGAWRERVGMIHFDDAV